MSDRQRSSSPADSRTRSPFETASISLLGNRPLNQDRCATLHKGDSALLLLADGMGGHPRGEMAAQILVDTGRTLFEASSKPIKDPFDFLEQLLSTAHEAIVDFGRAQSPPIDPRATAVVTLIQDGIAHWCHAGDSRCYLFRNYQIVQRTRDHSFVEQMRGRGMIRSGGTTEKRYRNLVTQCLGGTGLHFSTTRSNPEPLQPRDILLLCSDGLWGQIPDEKLLPQLRHHGSLDRMASGLARAATQAGAPGSDNVTLVTLRWLGEDAPQQDTTQPLAVPAAAADPITEEGADQLHDAISLLRDAIEDFEAGG